MLISFLFSTPLATTKYLDVAVDVRYTCPSDTQNKAEEEKDTKKWFCSCAYMAKLQLFCPLAMLSVEVDNVEVTQYRILCWDTNLDLGH